MQPQQAEKLRKMIQDSSLLSAAEKEEWLGLLVVMNDKQVSELEVILNTPEPSAKPMPTVAPAFVQAPWPSTPPLTHISNLPSNFAAADKSSPTAAPTPASLTKPRFPLPTPPKRTVVKQWEVKLRRTVEEKELPRPKPELELNAGQSSPKPAPAKSLPKADTKPPVLYPQESQEPKKELAKTVTPPKPMAPSGPVELQEPRDVAKLTLPIMRDLSENLVPTLKKIVAISNYFEVLFYLEKSPLYQTYLDTGRAALAGPGGTFPTTFEGKTLLTKAEFESFSDLLKSIQFG